MGQLIFDDEIWNNNVDIQFRTSSCIIQSVPTVSTWSTGTNPKQTSRLCDKTPGESADAWPDSGAKAGANDGPRCRPHSTASKNVNSGAPGR